MGRVERERRVILAAGGEVQAQAAVFQGQAGTDM
jgi:hypothetical protein